MGVGRVLCCCQRRAPTAPTAPTAGAGSGCAGCARRSDDTSPATTASAQTKTAGVVLGAGTPPQQGRDDLTASGSFTFHSGGRVATPPLCDG